MQRPLIAFSTYGQNFHTSIWHVALSGIDDDSYVEKVRQDYEEVCWLNTWTLWHMLKHF